MQQVQMSNLDQIRLNEETVPEFTQLSSSLNDMLNRLKKGYDVQCQFTGNAAHELRTPIAVVQAKLEVFIEEHSDILPETVKFLNEIQEQIKRLTELTKDLLEISGIQSVPRNKHIHLAPLIEEVFMDLTPIAEKQDITLKSLGDAGIYCSDILLYRLVYNLTENAIKYNHPGGNVGIFVEEHKGEVILYVSDTGIGIPKMYHDSIFQPFFRVEQSRSREIGGSGLGLSMVQEIAKVHGGYVKIRESSEKGTMIEVHLKMQQ